MEQQKLLSYGDTAKFEIDEAELNGGTVEFKVDPKELLVINNYKGVRNDLRRIDKKIKERHGRGARRLK